jgi:hypothetical protein
MLLNNYVKQHFTKMHDKQWLTQASVLKVFYCSEAKNILKQKMIENEHAFHWYSLTLFKLVAWSIFETVNIQTVSKGKIILIVKHYVTEAITIIFCELIKYHSFQNSLCIMNLLISFILIYYCFAIFLHKLVVTVCVYKMCFSISFKKTIHRKIYSSYYDKHTGIIYRWISILSVRVSEAKVSLCLLKQIIVFILLKTLSMW